MISFGAPLWLYGLILIPFLALGFWAGARSARKRLEKMVPERLRVRLVQSIEPWRRGLRYTLLLAGIALVFTSLARPQVGFDWEETSNSGRDIILAVDVSKSMLAEDVQPNRLKRAKLAAQDVIGHAPGDRIGLIAFAGSAFLQAPLTADHGAILNSLHELDTSIIPKGGTNLAEAIRLSVEAFGKAQGDRALVLFTDGEELDDNGKKSAEEAGQAGVKIFTVGVGSEAGGVIPLTGEDGLNGYLKNRQGSVVNSKLDEERLKEIAGMAGGFYVPLNPQGMEKLQDEGLKPLSKREADTKSSRKPIDRYQWPLGAAMFLLCIWFIFPERRKSPVKSKATVMPPAIPVSLLIAGICFGGTLTGRAETSARALDEYQLGKYQESYNLLEKEVQQKPDSSELKFNLGTSAYKAGKMDKALEAFSGALLADDPAIREKSHYNLGNTLFRRGEARKEKAEKLKEWRAALEHYDSALKLDSKDADAKFNRDVTARRIEDIEKEQKKEEQQKQDEQKKDQKKDDKKDDKKDQQKGDSKDQNKGDDKKEDQQDKGDQKEDKGEGKEQKDDSQSGSKPQEGKEGNDPQSKEESSGGQKKDDSEQKKPGGESQEQKQEGQPEKPSEQKNPGQPKPEEGNKEGSQNPEGKEQSPENQQASGSEAPEPAPEEKGERPRGEVAAADGKESEESKPESEAKPVAAAGKDGKMSESEAKALLEALKGEDARVVLTAPGKRQKEVENDW